MIIEKIIKEGATLIDVREEIELMADGSIPQAVHIPMGDLEEKSEEIMQMQTPIVFFCRAGGRAQKAIDYFQGKGMSDLHNGGGYEEMKGMVE